jgi:hypothetical protein
MKRRRSLYARLEIVRGEQCAQGAAWPAQRPSSWLVVWEAVSRWQVAHRRAVMVAKRRRHRPQEHAGTRWVIAQRAPAGHGGSRGAEAGRAFVSVSVSSASVRSPVSGAGVQHQACLSTRPLSGVRCGRLSVQMSGVQHGCPVSVGSRVHCVRPGGGGGWRWGRQPHGWDGRGRHGRPRCPGASSSAARAEPGGRGWRRSAGSAEGSVWTWPSSWAVVEIVASRPRGRPGQGWMGAGIARWWRAGVRCEAATTLRGRRVGPGAGSPGRCEPPGLDCDLRVRPWCGRSRQ